MNTPLPPDPPKQSWKPNVSTASSGIGGSIAVIAISIIHAYTKIEITPELAVAVGGLCTFIAGYIPSSGRQSA
jgi:hypothetical protein